jgi:hypothetical protein
VLGGDGKGKVPMIIGMDVGDKEITTVPRIMRTILTRAIRRSLDIGLMLERVKVAMRGRAAVNSTIFTPARNDRRNPTCE